MKTVQIDVFHRFFIFGKQWPGFKTLASGDAATLDHSTHFLWGLRGFGGRQYLCGFRGPRRVPGIQKIGDRNIGASLSAVLFHFTPASLPGSFRNPTIAGSFSGSGPGQSLLRVAVH